ncbi:MAG: hypothetical protein ACM3O7_10290 [Acidobacteriota bacterium]
MHARKLHLHSMVVHSILALVPVAAVAFLLEAAAVRIGSFGIEVWHLLVRVSLVIVLLAALPATLSGILERRHLYVTWHRTHKVKMIASLALVTLLIVELGALLGGAGQSPAIGLMIVVLNPLTVGVLSAYGLKMSLGRQSLAATSYRPALFGEPPVDILAVTARRLGEPADVIDVLEEGMP